MRRILLFSVLCILVNLSANICWDEGGKLVRPEANLNYSGAVTTLTDGSFMLLWSDAGNGGQQMKVQKVNESGDCTWTEPLLAVDEELYYPNSEMICETSEGDVVVGWFERKNPMEMHFQRFDIVGNRLWDDGGITIYPAELYDNSRWKMISSEEDGLYICWYDYNSVYGVYLEEDGSIGENWSESGEILLTGTMYNNFKMIADGFGGIITGSLSENGNELLLQRCDINANMLWGINGIVNEDLGSEDDFALINWGEGEYAVVVRQNEQYLANVIDASGDLEYAEMQLAGELSEGTNDEGFIAVRTSDDKLGLVWDEDLGLTTKLVMQKSAIGGGLEWEDSNFIFSCSSYQVRDINLIADSDGGLKIFLKGTYDEIDKLLLYFHYNSDGDLISGEEPVIIGNTYICPYGSNEYRIGVAESEVTGIFWMESSDDEAEDVIRYQYIDPEDNVLFDEDGDELHSALSGTTSHSHLETNGESSVIVWEDNRFEPDQIYLQLINDYSGENGFIEYGIPITDRTEREQNLQSICFSNDGETFCTVFEMYIDSEALAGCGVQVMNLAGDRLLGDEGLIFINAGENCDDVCVDTYEDGFTVAWSTSGENWMEPGYKLYFERIINNVPIWDGGLEVLQSDDGNIFNLNLAGDKVIWIRASFPTSQLMVQRFDDNGVPATGWGAEGLEITDSSIGENIKVIEYGDGVLVFWEYRDSWLGSYKGQYVSNAGEILWEDGGHEFLSDNMYPEEVQIYEDEIYILYTNGMTGELVIDKYDMDCNAVWSEETYITTGTGCYSLNIWQGLMVVYWTDIENIDLYAKIFNTDGSLVAGVPEDGIIVCGHSYQQDLVSSVIDESGNSIALWRDNRGAFLPEPDPALYIQRMDLTTLAVSEDNIEESYQIHLSNYPNPFTGSTTLLCDLPREAKDAQIDIYNIRGQKVRSLSTERNEVEWDCRNAAGKLVSAGIYLYQLSGEGIGSKVSRMILIK
ncbi:MAG: T9SS type A sorting domain-containing protein [Candidatus Cloacimonetes bacterium]|nr:T9SS type A sorting domain-containing protein [Candidatus Cloacimonadota bacterium]